MPRVMEEEMDGIPLVCFSTLLSQIAIQMAMVRTLRIWSLWFRHRLAVLATVFDSRDVFGKS